MSSNPPLTRQAIAAEALALIDEEGLEALSTRKLGARLGVEAMALYHHFANKKELLDEVSAHLLSAIRLPPETGGWRSWIGQVARAYRALGHAHPNAFPLLAARRFNAPAAFDFMEANLRVLTAAGFPLRDAARMTRIVGTFVNGVVQAEIATASALQSASPAMPSPERHPLMNEAAAFSLRPDMDGIFERGLTMILDGISRALQRAQDNAA